MSGEGIAIGLSVFGGLVALGGLIAVVCLIRWLCFAIDVWKDNRAVMREMQQVLTDVLQSEEGLLTFQQLLSDVAEPPPTSPGAFVHDTIVINSDRDYSWIDSVHLSQWARPVEPEASEQTQESVGPTRNRHSSQAVHSTRPQASQHSRYTVQESVRPSAGNWNSPRSVRAMEPPSSLQARYVEQESARPARNWNSSQSARPMLRDVNAAASDDLTLETDGRGNSESTAEELLTPPPSYGKAMSGQFFKGTYV